MNNKTPQEVLDEAVHRARLRGDAILMKWFVDWLTKGPPTEDEMVELRKLSDDYGDFQ